MPSATIIRFPDRKPSPVFDRENYRRMLEELRRIMAEPDDASTIIVDGR